MSSIVREGQPMIHSSAEEQRLIEELSAIYDGRAHGQYGLTMVNQRGHAVQSGIHARLQGLASTQVVAALLHDIGHMIHNLGDHPAAQGIDDCHENLGAEWLAQRFDLTVSEPVRLHVAAKRYLCTVDEDYRNLLSNDSVESLALQGGNMSVDEVARFESEKFWREAVLLRKIDELAKDPLGPMPPFSEFYVDILNALRAK